MKSTHIIILYCSGCGFKIYEKNSFKKHLKHISLPRLSRLIKKIKTCPICGRTLETAKTLRFLALKEFSEKYVNGRFFLEEIGNED